MPTFFLTPASLSHLSLLIFITFVIAHLSIQWVRARRQGEEAATMGRLLGIFGGLGLTVLFMFLVQVLYPSADQFAGPLQTVFLTGGLVCLLQFNYRFCMSCAIRLSPLAGNCVCKIPSFAMAAPRPSLPWGWI